MDPLSHLLSLAHTRVHLDVRCLLAGAFVLPIDPTPPGDALFHLLLAGTCQLQLANGNSLPMQAGDFVLLAPGQGHSVCDALPGYSAAAHTPPTRSQPTPGTLPLLCNTSHPDQHTVDLLCGRFSYDSGSGRLLAQALPDLLHVQLQDPELLRGLSALLRSEAAQQRPGGPAVVDALGQALLAMSLRAWSTGKHAPASLLTLAADARLGPSVQAMLQHPHKPWTIESLGALSGMSRATYARHFQRRSRMCVAELLQTIRMMHACELLRGTRRSLADIAAAVGYRSESAFGKAFFRIVGCTPGQWRRSCRRSWGSGAKK